MATDTKPKMSDDEFDQMLGRAMIEQNEPLIDLMTGGHTRDSFNDLCLGDDFDFELPGKPRFRKRRAKNA